MGKSIFQPSWSKSTKSTRFLQIKQFFVDQDILDIGCAVGYKKSDWLHSQIKNVSNSVFGIDIDKESIAEIKKLGFDVEAHDAQNFDLKKRFSLVHAGELIEHLDNFGGFLDSVKDHLNEGGRLLLTTPNALRINNFIYSISGGLRVNEEHTCWFCETTLSSLLRRKGFEIVEIGYIKHTTFGFIRKLFLRLRTLLLPEKVAWNTLYVIARKV